MRIPVLLIITILLFGGCMYSQAQNNSKDTVPANPTFFIIKSAYLPQCSKDTSHVIRSYCTAQAIQDFILSNFEISDQMMEDNKLGEFIVEFNVNKIGRVENPKIINSISPSIDKEALRVIMLLPTFVPGRDHIGPILYPFSIPCSFNFN